MLLARLNECAWPKRYKLKKFATDTTFIELWLTSNEHFQHNCEQLKTSGSRTKACCALCLDGQTRYGCSLCKVMLCWLPRNDRAYGTCCFYIWHNKRNLLEERQRILRGKPVKYRRKRDERSASRRKRKTKRDCPNEVEATSTSLEDHQGNNNNALVPRIRLEVGLVAADERSLSSGETNTSMSSPYSG